PSPLASGELVFLAFGLFYCYCVRSAPSDCGEVRCITAALALELCVSLAYHVARHFVQTSLHPDYVYLMYFGRCHATVTVTAALVLGPRLWYVHSPPRSTVNSRSLMYSQVDANLGEAMNPMAIASNGDVEVLETNISDMNPEDIRV
uniref:G_PROTEIN_RECEP_F3_4 domain-containing protein n=1 Tax=Macrostomum lignano TaxID=282301 RepID=A0A1I8JK74_9PLAT